MPANRDVATEQQLYSPTARDQVNDRNNQSDHQQQMDQAASHMESPAQKPEDNEDCKDRPKHKYPLKSEGYIDCHYTKGERQLLRAELSLKQPNSRALVEE